MLSEITLTNNRLEHELNRRRVSRERRFKWRTNYSARKQAADVEGRKVMALAAKAQQERSHTIVEAKRKPGLFNRVSSFFKPRTMQHA